MTVRPAVSVLIPVFNEEQHIDACLDAVEAQTYQGSIEVLVIDGGSTDRTRALVGSRPQVRLLDNPRRIQAAALNIGLSAATGDVIVRVDGHCTIADDYVERCLDALARTRAAMVGGAMRPVAQGWRQRGIAAAMASRIGAGPARFHVGGASGWVDTVYLGAYRRADALTLGGYAEDVGVNEDAEFAVRMARLGGVWFDRSIRSTYVPRSTFTAVARQFYRYGRSRSITVRRHPEALSWRQLVAPMLVVGLLLPWRRPIAAAYAAGVIGRAAVEARKDIATAAGLAGALPMMHLPWGAGFLLGLLPKHPAAAAVHAPEKRPRQRLAVELDPDGLDTGAPPESKRPGASRLERRTAGPDADV